MATPAKRLFRLPHPPARPSRRAASPTYRPRRPTATPLYPVVQHHLETFLDHAAEADPLGNGVAWWVEKDFRGYLRWGVPAHGFARARCEDCGHERLIPFSCKGRGICPSCNTRRMAELAAHLTDHVLPHLPIRQWVLSVPKRLRPFLRYDPDIAGGVLRIFLRAIRTVLRQTSPARIRWAVLLARIYEVLPLLCPACGGSMKVLAFITDPPVVSAILVYLDLPNKPPPLAPARSPPQREFMLDQTPSFDPADPEPVPDFQFDQSLPDDFGD